MESPIDHILGAFSGVQLVHLWPLAIMVPIILIVAILRRFPPRSYKWVKGKGFVGSFSAALDRAKRSDDPSMEDFLEKIRKDIAEKS